MYVLLFSSSCVPRNSVRQNQVWLTAFAKATAVRRSASREGGSRTLRPYDYRRSGIAQALAAAIARAAAAGVRSWRSGVPDYTQRVADARNRFGRYDFWRTVPRSSHVLFLAGVFTIFLPAGLLTDIPLLGANPPGRLAFAALLSGGIAVAYVVVVRLRRGWTLPLIGFHVLVFTQFERIAGPLGPPLTGDALRSRLALDVNGSTFATVIGFVLLSQLIRREGTRYVSAHAEIALAREIHQQLVPRLARTIGRFEFRGVSLASGEVGGDLIDVVESASGWTSYVADVSGHGVAAGLMMGMVKSTARTQLRTGATLDALLDTSNAVLADLKTPTMFVTFAGVQCVASALRFTVAGHFPILRCSGSTGAIEELSIAQLPLAMFPDTTYTSAETTYESGDLFVLFTDGLVEVFDSTDREFSMDRVKALVKEHGKAPLEAIEERLLAAVRAHGPQLDDQTLLLIRVL
jgi:serine phosphatase RsbU (regulator of sigma subunit)